MANTVKDNEVHITYEDQEKINCFARNNAKLTYLKEEIKELIKEKENYVDAADEIMMLEGDDDTVPYMIGDSFFPQTSEKAMEYLERRQTEIGKEMETLENKAVSINKILSDLKEQLYAKFGDNINLENDEEL